MAVLALAGCGLNPSNRAPLVDPPATDAPAVQPPPHGAGPGRAGTVTWVVDGDTVGVTVDGGAEIIVRVLGIDAAETPEIEDPSQPGQCWGPQARQFATDTLLGRPVRLVGDPTQAIRVPDGRLLAYVYLPDGSNYSVLAAAAGAARAHVYAVPPTAHPAITEAQDEARAAGRGLWRACGG